MVGIPGEVLHLDVDSHSLTRLKRLGQIRHVVRCIGSPHFTHETPIGVVGIVVDH